MIVTYRNNRLVPAIIITVCIWLFYCLIDPTVNNLGTVIPQWQPEKDVGLESAADATPSGSFEAPIVEPTHAAAVPASHHKSGSGISAEDVLLIMKTGSTSMWKRLLVHLPTTFSDDRISMDNLVIYSDYPETIGDFTVIDVLANSSQAAKARPDFEVYRTQVEFADNNVYAESAGVAGDNYGPPGGWVIDKYKFLPLMQHAGQNWPKAKWYIYMEDDAYLFLPNILAYLSSFDWQKPHYLGSYAAKSDVVFAHGGAGFVLSRGAWEISFGQNLNMAEDFNQYTADHCCGDQVLALALNKYGVRFGEENGNEKFTWGFNPVVHWNFGFSRWNWCDPLLSWHKVHNRDVARYYALEKNWDFTKPLRHCDFFHKMMAPALQKRIEWWDNQSGLFQVTSANKNAPPEPEGKHSTSLWKKAWQSVDACEAACKGWSECVQWSYVEDLCRMDDKMIMGQGYAPTMSERKTALMTTSGWLKERLENWRCD